MAARPYWSGQIRLSLVTLAVEIYAALSRSRQVPLHEIYRRTGKRVRHQKMAGDKPIELKDIVKGYEVEKDEYVLLEPKEIQELKIPSKKTIDIVEFVSRDEIDAIYFETPYFVVPKEGSAEDAFLVIRDALRATGKIGIGQLAIAGRERLCSIKPCGSGMILETLRYEDEIRKADPFFDEIKETKVDKDQLGLAKELIRRKTKKFDPKKFHDHYREALEELIKAKQHHRKPRAIQKDRPKSNVVNLMDALKKSLNDSQPAKKSATRAKPKPRHKRAG